MSLTKAQFDKMLAEHDRLKTKMDEVRGSLGNKFQDWEDNRGIHKGAFKLAAKLRRMEAAARTAFLEAFDEYRELGELDDSPTMWESEEDEAEAEAAAEPEESAPEEQESEQQEAAPEEKPKRGRKRKGNGAGATVH